MRTITAREYELIASAIGEGLTALPAGVIEKDLLITAVLQIVSTLESDGIQLIFCGGTCLSKAHGLIERMSEDIDFKLILPDGLNFRLSTLPLWWLAMLLSTEISILSSSKTR